MKDQFQAECRGMLIGSLPVSNHEAAADLVQRYSPEIPLWVQLPVFAEEGMVAQFAPGMPGLRDTGDRLYIEADGDSFSDELTAFYEDSLLASESPESDFARFAFAEKEGTGLYTFVDRLAVGKYSPAAVKGQVTGPITFCTGLTDQDRRAIFYDDSLREAALMHLSAKAAWQVRKLSAADCPVIIFFDEPALAGFGSSEFASISAEDVSASLKICIDAVHSAGGLAGIHVCANTDWSILLKSEVDIINFDAYAYFDKFILYPDLIKDFMKAGGILAWGIVPTLNAEDIQKESADSLLVRLDDCFARLGGLGIDEQQIYRQSLVTPSCGAGSLSPELAERVLELNQEISRRLRQRI